MKRNDIRKRKLKQKKGGFGLKPRQIVELFIKQVPLPNTIKDMVLSIVDIQGTFDKIDTIVDESAKLDIELKKGNDNKAGIFKQLGNFLEAIRDFILKIYETILTNVIITTFVSQIKEEMKTIADIAKQLLESLKVAIDFFKGFDFSNPKFELTEEQKNKLEEIKLKLNELVNKFKTDFIKTFSILFQQLSNEYSSSIKPAIEQAIAQAQTTIKDAGPAALIAFKAATSSFLALLSKLFGKAGMEKITKKIETIFDKISQILIDILDKIKNNQLGEILSAGSAIAELKQLLATVKNSLTDVSVTTNFLATSNLFIKTGGSSIKKRKKKGGTDNQKNLTTTTTLLKSLISKAFQLDKVKEPTDEQKILFGNTVAEINTLEKMLEENGNPISKPFSKEKINWDKWGIKKENVSLLKFENLLEQLYTEFMEAFMRVYNSFKKIKDETLNKIATIFPVPDFVRNIFTHLFKLFNFLRIIILKFFNSASKDDDDALNEILKEYGIQPLSEEDLKEPTTAIMKIFDKIFEKISNKASSLKSAITTGGAGDGNGDIVNVLAKEAVNDVKSKMQNTVTGISASLANVKTVVGPNATTITAKELKPPEQTATAPASSPVMVSGANFGTSEQPPKGPQQPPQQPQPPQPSQTPPQQPPQQSSKKEEEKKQEEEGKKEETSGKLFGITLAKPPRSLDELDVVFAKIESGKPLDDFINEVAEICKDNPKQGLSTVVTRLDKLIEKQGPGKDKINGKTKAEIIKAIEKKINELEQTIPGERGDALDFKRNLYFIHNISIFKIALRLIVMFCILLLFIILFLSIISVMAFFYYVIDYIITLFVNPSNITKLISLDYMHKSIIKYSLKDTSQDKLFIILGQRFNLNLFNVTSYTIYLLIFFFLFYVCHVFYASYMSKNLVGALGDLDKNGILISIFGIIFIYSLFNLGIYLLLFKPFVITPYRIIEKREQEIDKKIAELILITANTEDKTNIDENNILVDDNFFEILYDLSRIDELNNFFLNSIKDNNAAGCLEQKLIIYDLYMYLREYITFDKNMQKLFKDYCTSMQGDSKPKYNKYTKPSDDNDKSPRVTFISLLNNNEVKMIKKYHEDLDFFNNIPDEYNEFYNKLNKSIDKSLKEINNEIITSNKTVIPFFLSIIYIFIFFFITFFIVYLIIIYALDNDKKARPDEKFFGFFIFISQGIKTYFYDKIFKWLGY